jgi:hypothetical protein
MLAIPPENARRILRSQPSQNDVAAPHTLSWSLARSGRPSGVERRLWPRAHLAETTTAGRGARTAIATALTATPARRPSRTSSLSPPTVCVTISAASRTGEQDDEPGYPVRQLPLAKQHRLGCLERDRRRADEAATARRSRSLPPRVWARTEAEQASGARSHDQLCLSEPTEAGAVEERGDGDRNRHVARVQEHRGGDRGNRSAARPENPRDSELSGNRRRSSPT